MFNPQSKVIKRPLLGKADATCLPADREFEVIDDEEPPKKPLIKRTTIYLGAAGVSALLLGMAIVILFKGLFKPKPKKKPKPPVPKTIIKKTTHYVKDSSRFTAGYGREEPPATFDEDNVVKDLS
ncbi:unnamed protein product, partial [marine sediment metagenome]